MELSVVFLLAAVALACVLSLRRFELVRTTVYNVPNPDAFTARDLPGFVHQSADAPQLRDFRRHIAALIDQNMDSLTKVVVVRKWVRDQESDTQYYNASEPFVDDTEEPARLLDEQRRGLRSACRRFSYIFTGALLSIGEDARIIVLTEDIYRPALSHVLVEVWIKELRKWVLVDPTVDALVLVDKHPASALEAYGAIRSGSGNRISFEQNGSRHPPPPVGEYARFFKHVFTARTNAIFDGYRYGLFRLRRITFAHFAGPGVELYPQRRKEEIMVAFALASLAAVLLSTRIILLLGRGWNRVPAGQGRISPSSSIT